MPDGAEHRTFGKAGLGLVTVGALAATASVVAWSLASPSNDPVGAMVSRVGAGWERLTQWYAGNPVADRPNWSAMQVKLLDAQSARGPDAMVRYGCGACHVIPGVAGARGTVGPSLAGFADRAYIAGILTNAPGNLQRWLIDPPLFAPDTAMPDMSVTEADAADMAAYLLSLTGAP